MGKIAKESIRGTLVTYIGVAIGFVTTFFVLTRFLTAEEIGLSRVLIDASTLLASLAQLGTNASIIRFFPYFRTKGREKVSGLADHGFFFWTLVVPLVGYTLFCALFLLAAAPLREWFGQKSPLFVSYFYFVLPMAFFCLYQTVMETNATVREHIVVPKAVRELVTRIGLLVVYLLYAYGWLTVDGFVMAICAVYGVCALINTAYMFSLGEVSLKPDMQFLRENPDLVRSYLRYTGFLIVSALAGVLAPTLSSFFVTAQMGLSFAGIFAIATYIGNLVSIPSRSLNAIASPQLSEAIKNDDLGEISRLQQQVANNMLLIGGIILMAIWINIDFIFSILPNGETYAGAKHVVLLLGIGQLFVGTFGISINALNFSRYYAWSLLLSLLLTGSGVVLNHYLIPVWGIDGAAWAMMLSETLYYALAVAIIGWRLRTTPFSVGQMKTLAIILSLFVLNALWLRYLPMNILVSSIARSVVLGGAGLVAAYRMNISPELNRMVNFNK